MAASARRGEHVFHRRAARERVFHDYRIQGISLHKSPAAVAPNGSAHQLSKTLIGLMIDFSQVLMLTFVNAFKQAAGGNFVTALQLDKATSLRDIDTDDKNVYDLTQLIGASVLAVILLGVALTLVVIMTAFIAFRIVGLWLLIIMSPMAFSLGRFRGKCKRRFQHSPTVFGAD